MTCNLYGTKPLPEPILTYYQLNPQEHTSVNFQSKYKSFHWTKCIWKCSHLVQTSVSSCVTKLDSYLGLILGLQPANERRRYKVTPSLIGWANLESALISHPVSSHYNWFECAYHNNEPISQIQQRIRQMSHNTPFCNRNVHTCAHFCYKMVHCGLWNWCIVGFVQQVYSAGTLSWLKW